MSVHESASFCFMPPDRLRARLLTNGASREKSRSRAMRSSRSFGFTPNRSAKNCMFSRTLRSWYSENFCGMYPIWARMARKSRAVSSPHTETVPLSAATSVVQMRRSVDFPAPSAPIRPNRQPLQTDSETPASACSPV